MKTNNKISSFIGGLLIAFVIALVVPTAAQATGSHCTISTKCNIYKYKQTAEKYLEYYYRYYNYKYYKCYLYYMKKHDLCKSKVATVCNKYKIYAEKYLAAYYKCYHYKYYQCYLYYMKKYESCKSTVSPITVCNKYKIYADKYLAAYNKCGHYCYYKYYQYYLNLYNQCKANFNQDGKVCGQVFEDTNGNGTQDAGEPFYAGATVTITDVNGDTQTSTTNTNGKYCADVPAGSTEITLNLTSLPTGSTITTEDPTTIDVEAGIENDAGKYGFESSIAVGEVCGTVLLGGLGEENVTVNIVDASGNTHEATTDTRGKYCISGIAEGDATVTVDESTLPAGVILIAGENPYTTAVIANEIKYINPASYMEPW